MVNILELDNLELITMKQFCEKTGLSYGLVKRLIADDRLVFVKTKRRIYIDYEASMEKLWIK